MTALSNIEDAINLSARKAKWLLEYRLRALGADSVKAKLPMTPYVVADRNLYTGQNLAASRRLAECILAEHGAAD